MFLYFLRFLCVEPDLYTASTKKCTAKMDNKGREARRYDVKAILSIILFLIVASLAMMFLPLCIGVIVALFEFSDGNILGGIFAIVIGILIQIFWLWYMYNGEGSETEEDYECPNCGSSATDGNHCYECDDDF